MADIVTSSHEVILGDTRFPIDGEVQRQLVNALPGKIVIGEATRADQTIASEWAMQNNQGGLGIEFLQEDVHIDRYYWGTVDTRYKNRVVLGPRYVDCGTPVAGDAFVLGIDYGSNFYAVFGNKVYYWNEVTKSWTSCNKTLAHTPTDAVIFAGKLFIACSSEYYYLDGLTWYDCTDATDAAKFFCVYNENLLKINNNGVIHQSLTGASLSWGIEVCAIPVPTGHVNSFVVWRLADDVPAPYVGTRSGLWVVAIGDSKAYLTDLQTAPHESGGKGMVPFSDGNLYYPEGLLIHRYGNRMISTIGPNQDDGLPEGYRGRFVKLIPAHRWLLGIIENTQLEIIPISYTWGNSVIDALEATMLSAKEMGLSIVLAFNGQGWHVLFVNQLQGTQTKWGTISYISGETRFWFGAGGHAYYITVPDDVVNPLHNIDYEYAPSGELITGWFDSNFPELAKVGIGLKCQCQNITYTENIKIDYAVNGDNVWHYLGTITTNPDVNITNPLEMASGIKFYSIRFRFTFTRADITPDDRKKTPVLNFFSFRYQRVMDQKWGYQLRLNCMKSYGNKTPRELRQAIEAAVDEITLIKFIFMNEDGIQTKWVRITGASARMPTGDDPRTLWIVSVVEV